MKATANATVRELVTAVRESADVRFASVYYDSSHDSPDATKVQELTWREAREDLREQGADDATFSVLERAVEEHRPPVGRAGHGLIAAGGELVLSAELATPPARAVHRWSELPYIVPLVIGEPPSVAHLVVSVDRVGAEIVGVRRDGGTEQRTVSGHEQVHEPKPVGLPPGRLGGREHVHEQIRQNISDVADAVCELAEKLDVKLIVLSGETRGRTALREDLPDHLRLMSVEVPAARDPADLAERVRGFVAERQRERIAGLIERFRGELEGSGQQAADGIDATCGALREANVETLLIGDGTDELVVAGTDPIEIAADARQLDDLGISTAHRRRADEAIPLAAVAVGADLAYTGSELALTDGFGALLRYV